MYCNNCGTYTNGNGYCPNCGCPVNQMYQYNQNIDMNEPPKSNKGLIIAIAVIIPVAIIIFMVLVILFLKAGYDARVQKAKNTVEEKETIEETYEDYQEAFFDNYSVKIPNYYVTRLEDDALVYWDSTRTFEVSVIKQEFYVVKAAKETFLGTSKLNGDTLNITSADIQKEGSLEMVLLQGKLNTKNAVMIYTTTPIAPHYTVGFMAYIKKMYFYTSFLYNIKERGDHYG